MNTTEDGTDGVDTRLATIVGKLPFVPLNPTRYLPLQLYILLVELDVSTLCSAFLGILFSPRLPRCCAPQRPHEITNLETDDV